MSKKYKLVLITIAIIIIVTIITLVITTILKNSRNTEQIIENSEVSEFEKEVQETPDFNEAMEIANQEERERALREKEKFAEEYKDKPGTMYMAGEVIDDPEEIEKINKANENRNIDDNIDGEKTDSNDEKLRIIVDRYYSKEFIDDLIKRREASHKVIEDWVEAPLTDAVKELYEMMLNVGEKNELSNDEKEVVKKFLNSTMYDLKKDEQLKSRAEKILNN